MEPEPQTPKLARAASALGLALWAGLLGLALAVPPDGHEHADLGQFLGRLHPLAVHGPIALLVLVPFLELAGLAPRRGHLRAATGFVLALAAAATLAAAYDGWLLAWSEGLRGRDVTRHMWGGVWLSLVCIVAAWVRSGARTGAGRRLAYPPLLAFLVGLMVWTAHGGGSVAYGDTYLTDKMPARLRSWLGIKAAEPEAGSAAAGSSGIKLGPHTSDPSDPAFYLLHVTPILSRSCLPCHKPEKHKAGLRMDTYALLMKGGDNGAAIVPGNPAKSDLLRRVRLPEADDDYMPSDGLRPLTPEEIRTLERWIEAGAKGS